MDELQNGVEERVCVGASANVETQICADNAKIQKLSFL